MYSLAPAWMAATAARASFDDAAGDDRHVDALGVKPRDQVADVERDVHQHQVGAAAGAQHGERLLVAVGMGDGCALVHGDLACGGELACSVPTIRRRMA